MAKQEKEASIRERYSVYLNPAIMIEFKKYCLDKGLKTSQLMEELMLDRVKKRQLVFDIITIKGKDFDKEVRAFFGV